MAKTDKSDKLVGGEKVKLPKVSWSVSVRGPKDIDGSDDGTQVELSGEATDAVSAALIASQARQAIMDARNADDQLAKTKQEGAQPGAVKTADADKGRTR